MKGNTNASFITFEYPFLVFKYLMRYIEGGACFAWMTRISGFAPQAQPSNTHSLVSEREKRERERENINPGLAL